MDSPSAPQTPDPVVTANAQGQANIDAARVTTALNRANQYTPYGALTWSQGAPTRTFNQSRYDKAVEAAKTASQQQGPLTGYTQDPNGNSIPNYAPPDPSTIATPDRNADQFYDTTPSDQWSSQVTLNPQAQSIVDQQFGTSNVLAKQIAQMFANGPATADPALRQKMEDALYARSTSRLDPEYQQQEEAMKSSLMNRGVAEGSDAWKNLVDSFGRTKNDAYEQARNDAITGGGNEEARQLSMEQGSQTNAINQLNSMMTGGQAQMPSFAPTPSGASVAAAPIGQSIWNAYQGQMGQYNADVAGNNATMAAGASTAAAIAAAFI